MISLPNPIIVPPSEIIAPDLVSHFGRGAHHRSPSRSGSGSPPSQYLHSSLLSPDGVSNQDLPNFLITSMAQRGNIVIPKEGRLLQFLPPAPKEPDHPSFRRGSTHCAPPQKIQFPVDRSCADMMDNAFDYVLKKKSAIPAQELNLFKTNEADSDTYFTVPKIATEVTDKLRAEKYGPSYNKKFVFPDKPSKELNKMLENADRHLCHRAKVSSFSLLLSDSLARISEDPTSVDPDLLQTMFKFMDDCLSSCLREFAVGSAITTSIRRFMILDNMFWPPQGARE